jgi:hypothetical protein
MRKAAFSISLLGLAAVGLVWYFKAERAAAIVEINHLAREQAELARAWRVFHRDHEAKTRAPADLGTLSTSNSHPRKADRPGNSNDDPAYQLKYAAYSRVRYAILYGSLFRKLGLSDAQISQFIDNKIRWDTSYQDIMAGLQAEGLRPTDPIARKLLNESSAEYRSAQTDVLGSDGFALAKQFENLLPAHEFVDDLAGGATVAGMPFSADQIKALTDMVTQALMPDASGKSHPIGELNWPALESAAQSILTPEQLYLFTSTDTPGPTGSSGSRFMHQMTSLIQSRARIDAGHVKP